MWRMPVIIVPVNNNVPSSLLTCQIALSPDSDLTRQADIADMLIGWYKITDRVGAVVNNDQFFVGVVLAQKVFNSLRHGCATVVGWHDAGDQRGCVTSRLP